MNNKIFILNASPIILLGKADLLKTISPLAESWIVPEGVVAEVEAKRSIDSYLSDLAKASNVSRSFVEHIHPLIATLFKIPLVGSLGLLVMAKRKGHIYAARPELEKLIKSGLRIDFAMLDRIYKKIGE